MRYLITGTAGFIGYHLARRLLDEGHAVTGFDAVTDYYDVGLKEAGSQSTGMGLAITRGRLESLYGEKQSLALRDVQTGGAEVRITLPFRRHVEVPVHPADTVQVGDRRFDLDRGNRHRLQPRHPSRGEAGESTVGEVGKSAATAGNRVGRDGYRGHA